MIYYNKAPDPTVGYDLVVRLDRIVVLAVPWRVL